jgi:hypothetical protein
VPVVSAIGERNYSVQTKSLGRPSGWAMASRKFCTNGVLETNGLPGGLSATLPLLDYGRFARYTGPGRFLIGSTGCIMC